MLVSLRLVSFVVMLCPLVAAADIYECVDQNGSKRFTNIESEAKGCKRLNVTSSSAPPPPPAKSARPEARAPVTATPSNFPRVDRALQRERDNDRRRILENELAAEEKLLGQAKKELAEQESVRLGNEKNYQRVLDRLKPYQDTVEVHQKNVEALKRELGNLSR